MFRSFTTLWLVLPLVAAFLASCASEGDAPPELAASQAKQQDDASSTEEAASPKQPPHPGSPPGSIVGGEPVPTIERLPDPAGIGDSAKGLANGAFAPQLDLPDLAGGGRYRFSAHVGPEATAATAAAVVGFTASWCGPCKSSYPYLKTMQEQFGDELEVVLVSVDPDQASREKHAAQVRAAGLDAPVLAPGEDTLRAWLGRRRNVPHFYIINKVGEVLVQDRGFGKNVRRVLPKQIGYALRHPEYVVRNKKRK